MEVARELQEYNQLQAILESDFSDFLKICEGYEANSMYHYFLRFYMKKLIEIPPKLEKEDGKQIRINRLKLTQAKF